MSRVRPMWNLPKGDKFLQSVSIAELEQLYKKEQKAKPKTRLLCALHRRHGESIDKIASITTLPRRTIHETLHRFIERGISAKDSMKQPGKHPLLTVRQRKKLVKDMENGPPYNKNGLWSTKEVRNLLKQKYGVSFVNQHVWRIITSLGFTMQRPRKRHYKSASDTEIKAFKKSRGERQGNTERKDLLWARKMRPHSA